MPTKDKRKVIIVKYYYGAKGVGVWKQTVISMPSLGFCEKSLSFLVLGGVWSQD